MERDEIVAFVQNAIYQLNQAKQLAPAKSNLADDLDSLLETADEVQSALQGLEYNDVGMAV